MNSFVEFGNCIANPAKTHYGVKVPRNFFPQLGIVVSKLKAAVSVRGDMKG